MVGDGYPSEAKLCERFSASRTAVRRVLAQMEGSGLLATVHGKGRTVRSPRATLPPVTWASRGLTEACARHAGLRSPEARQVEGRTSPGLRGRRPPLPQRAVPHSESGTTLEDARWPAGHQRADLHRPHARCRASNPVRRLGLETRPGDCRAHHPARTWCPVPGSPKHGMHALRPLYASVLLHAGETIKALSTYLGHTDPGFTLKMYTHLLPSGEGRTRKAVDNVFQGSGRSRQ